MLCEGLGCCAVVKEVKEVLYEGVEGCVVKRAGLLCHGEGVEGVLCEGLEGGVV